MEVNLTLKQSRVIAEGFTADEGTDSHWIMTYL